MRRKLASVAVGAAAVIGSLGVSTAANAAPSDAPAAQSADQEVTAFGICDGAWHTSKKAYASCWTINIQYKVRATICGAPGCHTEDGPLERSGTVSKLDYTGTQWTVTDAKIIYS
jgi:hypothetical protein